MIPRIIVALTEEELDRIVAERAALMETFGRTEFLTKFPSIAAMLDDLRFEWKRDYFST
jgi:hypothetical protein